VHSGQVQIRAMEERDLERVLAIAASLRDAPHWPRTAYVEAIAADGVLRRIALVAEMAGQITGFSVASVVAGQAELESIAVVESAQRCGIGVELLRITMREAKSLGAHEMVLEVRASNICAAALYAKAGFGVVGRRLGYYGNPVEDAILLGFKLDGA
jgi:ribosomal-protein-alanine N-acetyltransferase